MRYYFICLLFLIALGCDHAKSPQTATAQTVAATPEQDPLDGVSLVVLGTLQDAGAPQIGCTKSCCAKLYNNPDPDLMVVSLGIIDSQNKQHYLIEATPDISRQAKILSDLTGSASFKLPDGIFTTHAHIGHYTGLQFLGKEAMNANKVTTYAMPKMRQFISSNGPWDQLIKNNNINLAPLADKVAIGLSSNLSITPLVVPHRDEYSETVGYLIKGPNKSALFIPDIDKWERWNTNINALIKTVDYAFIDATFYSGDEINTRDISQIPHPFIIESMERFKNQSLTEKAKIHFIHFNHTNPVLDPTSAAYKNVIAAGFNIAYPKQRFAL